MQVQQHPGSSQQELSWYPLALLRITCRYSTLARHFSCLTPTATRSKWWGNEPFPEVGVWFLTKHEDKNDQPLFKNTNYEKSMRLTSEFTHEFTNLLTAVIGYSELALHAIEDAHPAREWMEKTRKHTRELGALLQKSIARKQSKRGEDL
jgi:hypothetical protein